MVRNKTKWRFSLVFSIILMNVFTKSLPIERKLMTLDITEPNIPKLEVPNLILPVISDSDDVVNKTGAVDKTGVVDFVTPNNDSMIANNESTNDTVYMEDCLNGTRSSLTRSLRPGQTVNSYAVHITFDGDSFHGKVVIDVRVVADDQPLRFHVENLDINQVRIGPFSEDNADPLDEIPSPDDGVLEIEPQRQASSYFVIIEYTGQLDGRQGLFKVDFQDQQYILMNLFPMNARRVFPCMDELTAATTISFTFDGVPFENIVSNSRTEDDNPNAFRALQVPPHLWGMVAHNFVTMNIPVINAVQLYGRGNLNQDSQASTAINAYYTAFNEWTNKEYLEINLNQDGRMHIFALPDTNTHWTALSTICIWEPYILMENIHSVKQRNTVLVTIAEAMASQWFGYLIYPWDWKDQWVISGLAEYAAYEVYKNFQASLNEDDVNAIDVNAIFLTDIIQESLLRDSYASALVLSPEESITEEQDNRQHMYTISLYKAPAMLRMLRIILGSDDDDVVQRAGQTLLRQSTQTPVSEMDFFTAVSFASNSDRIDNVEEYLEPWIRNVGYPVLTIGWRTQNVIFLTQEHFSFTTSESIGYNIPITFTTSVNPDYENVYATTMVDNTVQLTLPETLDEDDYVIANIQGQGYYRVNYDIDFWQRIINALDDPERRNEIHPLNRATLIDDALNLARGGKVDYDIALQLVLTWQHETEYAPWKAFVRSMDFLRKRLEAFVFEDEDLDPNIYVRMVQRTIAAFEDQIGFNEPVTISTTAMTLLTRGLVMDHACRANYDPCIAAAIDLFYDPNSDEPTVNPDIPHDIRPAVYCTMVREGDQDVINLLNAHLESGITHYERLVILESLACSRDDVYINRLLMDTIADGNSYGVEERSKIMAAVIRSSYSNLRLALLFISQRTEEIRNMYGGPGKLEEILYIVSENIPDDDLTNDFRIYVHSTMSNLWDSEDVARRALAHAVENLQWDANFRDIVYEWIDLNGSHTAFLSFGLLCLTALITLLNN